MLIINADDWGGWSEATDAALGCYKRGRITSVSAMVFMRDSERAADLAKEAGLEVGLHLNFNLRFTGHVCSEPLQRAHLHTMRFLRSSKYSLLLYHPLLRTQFRYSYQAQVEEFVRLYGNLPCHVNGHQHMHLCSNVLIDRIIPDGTRIRRSFSFWSGEKSLFNRCYRSVVDRHLSSRHRVTAYFFSLAQCLQNNVIHRVRHLARNAAVELMVHPEHPREYDWLNSDEFSSQFRQTRLCEYSAVT